MILCAGPMAKVKLKISKGQISADLKQAKGFSKAIIIANGAGAPMNSPFISFFHTELNKLGYFTAKFNFFYQESGRKSPDRQPLLFEAYQAVLDKVKAESGLAEKDIVLGGKSMGGRIASMMISETKCKKLILWGYPLHAPGKKDKLRDEHLYGLKGSQLFLQGTRDSLCDLDKLRPVLQKVKGAKLYIVEGGDHSLKVLKRGELTQEQAFANCLSEIKKFVK